MRTKPVERKTSLNGIRGVMAIAIILSHCGWLRDYEQTKSFGNFVVYLWGGTTFFFMLSGYFFQYTLKEEPFRKYILKKVLRIYPIHLLTLTCSVCLLYLRGQFTIRKNCVKFFLNLFLLHAWVPNEDIYFSFNSVSWFLSCLLVCYVVAWFLSKKKFVLFWIVAGIGYVFEIMVCIVSKETHYWLLYINPIFRMVDFCSGVCICKWCRSKKSMFTTRLIFTVNEFTSIGMFLGTALLAKLVEENWTFNCIWAIPIACMIESFSAEKGTLSFLLQSKYLQKLGDISMELFMTHKFIINNIIGSSYFVSLAKINAFLSLLFLLLLCFSLALFTHWLISYISFRRSGFVQERK